MGDASSDKVRSKILVFGPLRPPEVACGISSAVRAFAGSRIREQYDIELVSTFRAPRDRALLERLAFGMWLGAKTIVKVVRSGAVLADINSASDRSLLSHAAVLFGTRLAGRPALLRIHGGEFVRVYERAGSVHRALIRFILRSATRVVALSEGWKSRVEAIEPRAVIEVVPNSVDFRVLESASSRPLRKCRRVLFLASFSELKGHFDTLEALVRLAPRYPDLVLALGGEDRDPGTRARIEREAERLGVRRQIEFLGVVSGTDKVAALRDADVLILPSHTENMPVSVMEGMACGLPVVATAVGAVGEMIIDGRTGFLIEPRDPGALAASLERLLQDPELGRRLGRAAQHRAQENWDADVVAQRTMSIYRHLTSHANCRPQRPPSK